MAENSQVSSKRTKAKEILITVSTPEGVRIDLDVLRSLLCRPECKDKKVAVISVTGDGRSGKSFLLNYMIRYLRARGRPDWTGETDTPLTGFKWNGGSQTVTTEITSLNTLFPVTFSNGEDGFLMLLDTENLVILIRNWKHNEDYSFGRKGGEAYLNCVSERAKTVSDNARTFEAITSCFETTCCVLLPRPGETVSEDINYNGSISGLTERFRDRMVELIVSTLQSITLHPKKLKGQDITCGRLFELCESYNQLVNSGRQHKLQSIAEANAMIHLKALFVDCIHHYKEEMITALGQPEMQTIEWLDEVHETLFKDIVEKIKTTAVCCDQEFLHGELDNLRKVLSDEYAITRRNIEHELENEAQLDDCDLQAEMFDEYEGHMNVRSDEYTNVDQLQAIHEKAKQEVIASLMEDMRSKSEEFRTQERVLLENQIEEKYTADKRKFESLQDEGISILYGECEKRYMDRMSGLMNPRGLFESITNLEHAHAESSEAVIGLFDEKYIGPAENKGKTLDAIKLQLISDSRQFLLKQRNFEKKQRLAVNQKEMHEAHSKFDESVLSSHVDGDTYKFEHSLQEAHLIARSYWDAHRIGSQTDWIDLDQELSRRLNDSERCHRRDYVSDYKN